MFFYSSLFALVATGIGLANAQTTTPACSRNYTVVSGDTCNGICASQGVSTFQLDLNNPSVAESDCTTLQVGQILCLGLVGQDCTTVHVVVENDTCETIVTQANITLDTLLANNQNVNAECTNILVGEVLCTASQVIDYTLNTTTTTAPPQPSQTTKVSQLA